MAEKITNKKMLELIFNKIDNREDDVFNAFSDIKKDITEIKKQTTKTNGRVTQLEYLHESCKIKEIEQQTEVLRFFAKHPNVLKFFIFILITLLGINSIDLINKLISLI